MQSAKFAVESVLAANARNAATRTTSPAAPAEVARPDASEIIRQRKSATVEIAPSRKDIELFPSGLPRCGSSLQKTQDFAPLFRDAVIARCSLSLRSAGFATLHSTKRDHCGVRRISFAARWARHAKILSSDARAFRIAPETERAARSPLAESRARRVCSNAMDRSPATRHGE